MGDYITYLKIFQSYMYLCEPKNEYYKKIIEEELYNSEESGTISKRVEYTTHECMSLCFNLSALKKAREFKYILKHYIEYALFKYTW